MTELTVYVKNTFFEACSLDDEVPILGGLRRSGSCPSLSPTIFAGEDESCSSTRLSCLTKSSDPSPATATTASPRWADSDDNSVSSHTGGEELSYDSEDDEDRLWPMPQPCSGVTMCPFDLTLATQAKEPGATDLFPTQSVEIARTPLTSKALAFTPPPSTTPLSSKAVAYMPTPTNSKVSAFVPVSSKKKGGAGSTPPASSPARAPAGPAPAAPQKSPKLHAPPAEQQVHQGEGFTTAMMRNLPCGMTRSSLTRMLDKAGFTGKYDFLYMPIDFHTTLCMGYAFVNMVSEAEFLRLMKVFQAWTNWPLNSAKICAVSPSQTQGLTANIERYQNSPVMSDAVPDDYKPVLFVNRQKVPFPKPTKPLPHIILRKQADGFPQQVRRWQGQKGTARP